MKLFDKIKEFFSTPSSTFCIWFDDISSFMDYITENPQYSQRYLYYYKGTMKQLVGIISNEGEKYIPDMSLEFIDNCQVKDNNLTFKDALFFSDIMSFVAEMHNELDLSKPHKWIFKSDNSGTHTLKKAVIANNDIYLCSD